MKTQTQTQEKVYVDITDEVIVRTTASGSFASYMQCWNKKEGYKLFPPALSESAELSIHRQTLLHQHGFAPDVLSGLKHVTVEGQKYIAYKTQHAPALKTVVEGCDPQLKAYLLGLFETEIFDMADAIQSELGFPWVDTHCGNFGVVRDGLVVIDMNSHILFDDPEWDEPEGDYYYE